MRAKSRRSDSEDGAIQSYLALLFTGSPRELRSLAMTKKKYDLVLVVIRLCRDSTTMDAGLRRTPPLEENLKTVVSSPPTPGRSAPAGRGVTQ